MLIEYYSEYCSMKRISYNKFTINEALNPFFDRWCYTFLDACFMIFRFRIDALNCHKRFTAGTERVVVNFRGVRILLEVCYDLRFPVWSRNLGDYDMILYVASWPTPRVDAWSALLRARAIENQCYVAGVNRMGTDPTCEYSGGSAIIDPYGKTIAECPWSRESAVSADIDMEALQAFRKKFPVLDDADPFTLI